MKEHKELLKAIGIAVGVAATAWGIYTLAVNASAIATAVATAATNAWNIALKASPIGWIITALAVMTGAVVYCYNEFGKFRGVVWATWAVIKEVVSLIGDAFKSVYHIIHGAFTFNWSEVKQGWAEGVSVVTDAAKRIGDAAKKGYEEGVADFGKDQKKEGEGLVPKKTFKANPLGQGPAIKEPKSKATGTKSVTINVSIKDLIGTQNINTTTLKEGLPKIKDMIVQVLSGAVNDFQIVADH
jgi:hypothetical protein